MEDMEEGYGGTQTETAPPARTAKAPRGKVGRTVVVTKQEFAAEPRQSADATFSAMFDATEDDVNHDEVFKIRVFRHEPREGIVGYVDDMEATESLIKSQWGGSTYRLEGMNVRGRKVRTRMLEIAGEPIFMSEAAEITWRKAKGLPPRQSTTSSGVDPQAILAQIESREEKRRAEDREREDKRREEERLRDEAKRKDEQERLDRIAKEERAFKLELENARREAEDRRRREDQDRDERRKKDEDEREARRRADMTEREARSREHMQQMLTIVQQSSQSQIATLKEIATLDKGKGDGGGGLIEAMKTLAIIKESGLMGGGGGGDEEPADPLTMVAKNGHLWLQSLGDAIRGTIQEAKSPRGAGQSPQQQQLAGLPPRLAGKVQALGLKVAGKGHDPERFFEAAIDRLDRAVDGEAPPADDKANTDIPLNMRKTEQPAQAGTVVTPDTTPTRAVNAVETASDGRQTIRVKFGKRVDA